MIEDEEIGLKVAENLWEELENKLKFSVGQQKKELEINEFFLSKVQEKLKGGKKNGRGSNTKTD